MLSQRVSLSEPFGAPVELVAASGTVDRPLVPTWMSPDGCRLYLQTATVTGGALQIARRAAQ
jgi:hypothetical protein